MKKISSKALFSSGTSNFLPVVDFSWIWNEPVAIIHVDTKYSRQGWLETLKKYISILILSSVSCGNQFRSARLAVFSSPPSPL